LSGREKIAQIADAPRAKLDVEPIKSEAIEKWPVVEPFKSERTPVAGVKELRKTQRCAPQPSRYRLAVARRSYRI
jgi:hypothetical protein